ncbi:TrkA family potassium uptake protein [candidate division WOR-3 bacterium]|nr:TrkA family potassium uptake protein [candidate division WOR-3 bacterium]
MKDVVVIGLGAFGSTVALELAKRDCNVLVIDRDEEQVEALSQYVVNAVTADATDPRALKEAGVENFKIAVVSVGEDIASSILITMNLKELGVDYVVTKATTELQGRILRKIGADKVIFPERDIALRTAESIANPSIFEYIELSPSYGIIEIVAPPQVIGKTLRESQIRSKYGLNLIAIKREVPIIDEGGKTVLNEEIIVSPSSDEKLIEGDVLVLIGKYDDLERFKKLRR